MNLAIKSTLLGPLLDDAGLLTQRFTALKEELAQILAFREKQDRIVIEQQRQSMTPKDFTLLTSEGQYPYYGSTGGSYTYIFTPGAKGHTLMVVNAVTKAVLSFPYGERYATNGEESWLEFSVAPQRVLDWLQEVGVKAGSLHHSSFAFHFTPTAVGTVKVISVPTGDKKDFSDYENW